MPGPFLDFVSQIVSLCLPLQVGEMENEILVFASVELITAEPAEQDIEAAFGDLFTQQEMRKPGGGSDRLTMRAHHAPHHIEQIEIFN